MSQSQSSLILDSRLESLQRLEGFITDVMQRNRLDEDMRGNVMISTLEAVTNAIRHGNGLQPDRQVEIDVFESDERLEIVVTDEGPGFVPETVPDPTDPMLLLKEGGRGVYLMQALTDECAFENDGRTVRLGFSCAGEATPTVGFGEPAMA